MTLGQFFEDSDMRLSMTRLLCFLSFFPASYVLIRNTESMNIADLLGWYLGAYVFGYSAGKFSDAINSKKAKAE